jgi:Tol biopolymer transport system component
VFVRDLQINQTNRVSVASNGTQGNGNSFASSISTDGRYVVFESFASNLVSGDTNGVEDVFVHDRQTGQTSRVSVASNGVQGNDPSYTPFLSADGRYVAFASDANNLVSGDTNSSTADVFVRDLQTNQTSRVSVASSGTQGNDFSSSPSLSTDGRYVAFISEASNLVSGDTNGVADIFVHDRQTGQTSRVSVASSGTQGNSGSFAPYLSPDGRYVAFQSTASNLISGDTNNRDDVFVRDWQTGQTSRVSVASNGTQGNGSSFNPSPSAAGHYVAFESFANNLVDGDTNSVTDVFVHAFPVYVYLPLVLKPPPTGALTFENYTGNPIFVNLIGYDTRTFPTSVGPHLWAGIPVDTYDWEATGTCNGQSGTVGSTQTGGNFRAPITIIANQTVLLNAERGGKFTCG